MLIDTHAHLYWPGYEKDLGEVIQHCLEAEVTTIINVGVDVQLSQKAAEFTSDKIKFYSTIGIHPHEAVKYKSDKAQVTSNKLRKDAEELENIYRKNPAKVVAVGECGLDYFFDHPGLLPNSISINQAKKLQRQLFQAQIDLAKKLNLPLIVHCRDDRSKNPENSEAWDEVLEMVGNHPTILHCYSGLIHTTKYILHTTNLLVSFAATITYPKNEYLREAVKLLPLEKIVLETDCPFLPPQSKRGQRNEPANVLEVTQLIAELKNVSLEEVCDQTTTNVKKIFQLS
ncbi:TatD family hydrolase [Candidatus Daviesbacteria bacterium]|nr:TatD family hydrolase [Candidatus Daviesbacteria bacterium]